MQAGIVERRHTRYRDVVKDKGNITRRKNHRQQPRLKMKCENQDFHRIANKGSRIEKQQFQYPLQNGIFNSLNIRF